MLVMFTLNLFALWSKQIRSYPSRQSSPSYPIVPVVNWEPSLNMLVVNKVNTFSHSKQAKTYLFQRGKILPFSKLNTLRAQNAPEESKVPIESRSKGSSSMVHSGISSLVVSSCQLSCRFRPLNLRSRFSPGRLNSRGRSRSPSKDGRSRGWCQFVLDEPVYYKRNII